MANASNIGAILERYNASVASGTDLDLSNLDVTTNTLNPDDVGTVAAAGSGQSTATAITNQVTYVTASDGAKGVVLPSAAVGSDYVVYNTVAANLLVYPASGDDINDATANAPITLVNKAACRFVAIDTGTWLAIGGINVQFHAAVTATTGGGTTGLIPAEAYFVTVTSDSAAKQISLPLATIGKTMIIKVGATACELISAVAADKVNNVVVGATNELALTASATYFATFIAANNWVIHGRAITGADIADAALVPDAL